MVGGNVARGLDPRRGWNYRRARNFGRTDPKVDPRHGRPESYLVDVRVPLDGEYLLIQLRAIYLLVNNDPFWIGATASPDCPIASKETRST